MTRPELRMYRSTLQFVAAAVTAGVYDGSHLPQRTASSVYGTMHHPWSAIYIHLPYLLVKPRDEAISGLRHELLCNPWSTNQAQLVAPCLHCSTISHMCVSSAKAYRSAAGSYASLPQSWLGRPRQYSRGLMQGRLDFDYKGTCTRFTSCDLKSKWRHANIVASSSR